MAKAKTKESKGRRRRSGKRTPRSSKTPDKPKEVPQSQIVKADARPMQPFKIDRDRMQLLANVIAKGATKDELSLFATVCERTKLDPFSKQIFFWKEREKCRQCSAYWDSNSSRYATKDKSCPNCGGTGQVWVPRIYAGVNGMHAVAKRHKEFQGIQSGVVYEGDDYEIDHASATVKHIEKPREKNAKIILAWAVSKYEGRMDYLTTIRYSEYQQLWKKRHNYLANDMPDMMMKKSVEACNLRRAIPEDLSDVYEPAEFGGTITDKGLNLGELLPPEVAPASGQLPEHAEGSDQTEEPPQPNGKTDQPVVSSEEMDARQIRSRIYKTLSKADVNKDLWRLFLVRQYGDKIWPKDCGCSDAQPGESHVSMRHVPPEHYGELLNKASLLSDGLCEIGENGQWIDKTKKPTVKDAEHRPKEGKKTDSKKKPEGEEYSQGTLGY